MVVNKRYETRKLHSIIAILNVDQDVANKREKIDIIVAKSYPLYQAVEKCVVTVLSLTSTPLCSTTTRLVIWRQSVKSQTGKADKNEMINQGNNTNILDMKFYVCSLLKSLSKSVKK